ncbi:MAG: response regulator [Mariniblastus sp.]|nr:response regulator [Mariniblastus sp.]
MPVSKKSSQNEGKLHVLIVDDDREIAESLRYALTNEGFQVSVAPDGNQGVAYVEAKKPDLVILDMMMPRRSGFLVLERLRQVFEEPVKVIMITGNEGTRHREYAELLGVNDYIHKPFTIDRLLASVSNLLGTE